MAELIKRSTNPAGDAQQRQQMSVCSCQMRSLHILLRLRVNCDPRAALPLQSSLRPGVGCRAAFASFVAAPRLTGRCRRIWRIANFAIRTSSTHRTIERCSGTELLLRHPIVMPQRRTAGAVRSVSLRRAGSASNACFPFAAHCARARSP